MKTNYLKAGFFLLAFGICLLFFEGAVNQEHIEKVRHGIKEEDYRLPPNASELALEYTFPTAEDEKNGIYLNSPQGFYGSNESLIYVSDARNNEVYIFDLFGKRLRTIGRFGQGPGEFVNPKELSSIEGMLLVRDIGNSRIQFFDKVGEYVNGFRLFRAYYSLVACDGQIYGTPILPPDRRANCLIDVLDTDGRLTRSFGAFLDVNQYDTYPLDRAYLAVGTNNELWVSFAYFPIVRKYSFGGELLNEYRFSYGIADKKDAFNNRMMAQRTKYAQLPYYYIIDAIYATDKGLYLIGSAEKRLDIILMSHDGQLEEFYWFPLDKRHACRGLLVLEEKGGPKFFALDLLSARVEVYSIKKFQGGKK